jgi:exodeoxyribonuclease VII small subunit
MTEPQSFEDALAALEAKVEELARGDVPLDRALATFEEGLALYRQCHEMLDKAEQRVTKLVAATDGLKEEPLTVP